MYFSKLSFTDLETFQVQYGGGGILFKVMARSHEEDRRSFWYRCTFLLPVSQVVVLYQHTCVCFDIWICDSAPDPVSTYGTDRQGVFTECNLHRPRTAYRFCKFNIYFICNDEIRKNWKANTYMILISVLTCMQCRRKLTTLFNLEREKCWST